MLPIQLPIWWRSEETAGPVEVVVVKDLEAEEFDSCCGLVFVWFEFLLSTTDWGDDVDDAAKVVSLLVVVSVLSRTTTPQARKQA